MMKTIYKMGFSLILLVGLTYQTYASFSMMQEKQTMYYLVDGVHKTAKEVDKLGMENVEKIEYVKVKEKIRQYTKEDVDVVVLITMKKPKSEADSLQ